MRNNVHIQKSDDLVTTHEAKRNGFLDYALRRNKESIPFIDRGKALKACLQKNTRSCNDILKIESIYDTLLQAAGISVKANAHLTKADKSQMLAEFVEKVLKPSGSSYIDETVYRYLLTSGDALGGKMRNIIGSIASEKLSRFIVSQLQIQNITFDFALKQACFVSGGNYSVDIAEEIKALRWSKRGGARSLVYNVNVPHVKKNIDIVLLNKKIHGTDGKALKSALDIPDSYEAIGELKGGIDPAGADEHWKTANTALGRVREAFHGRLPLFFIGGAIEVSMAFEIFKQCDSGDLANCANLTNDDQLASLCEWLVSR